MSSTYKILSKTLLLLKNLIGHLFAICFVYLNNLKIEIQGLNSTKLTNTVQQTSEEVSGILVEYWASLFEKPLTALDSLGFLF